ncbi:MAG TPA: hypothetical protein VHD76_12310 [Bryobacteraceae bacterium]|jgi:hypothetical protein|nr:hypothetical protein [Bryobacteraceae bacterium]
MPYAPLRIVVGLLCVFFAHFLGRAAVRVKNGRARQATLVSWVLRTFVSGVAVLWHVGLDGISLGMIVLSLISCAGGIYLEFRPRHHEELEKVIFPR